MPTPVAPANPDLERRPRGLTTVRPGSAVSLLGIPTLLVAPLLIAHALRPDVPIVHWRFGPRPLTMAPTEELLTFCLLGVQLLLASLVAYADAFHPLRRSAPGFGAPLAITAVGILGFLLLLDAFDSLLLTTAEELGCGPADPSRVNYTVCLSGADPMVFGATLAFVGWLGFILGVYRIGQLHASTPTRASALLSDVALMNVLGPVVTLLDLRAILLGPACAPRSGAPPVRSSA